MERPENLTYFLKKLKFIGRRLSLLSLIISAWLISNILLIAFFASSVRYTAKGFIKDYYDLADVYPFTLIVPIIGIFFLFYFSITRKQGMIFYEEVTDELDWSANRKDYKTRPSIEYRVAIKEFLKATDLPFTSGANGQAFYLAFFVIMLMIAIILKIIVRTS